MNSNQNLEKIRHDLMYMLANLANQAEIVKHGLEIEQHADLLDRAVNESNRMTSAALGERDRMLIAEVTMALERIDQGTYGVCDRCDEEIAPRRLELVPWATMCRECQEHKERTDKDKLAPPVRKLQDHGREIEAQAKERLGGSYVYEGEPGFE